VGEGEALGVQELARERAGPLRAAVDAVAGDRVADRRQMDAELVRAPRLGVQLQQRVAVDLAQDVVARARLAAAGDDGHLLALHGMARDRRVDDALRRLEPAFDEREVRLLDAPLLELTRERNVGRVVLRDDDQAGRVLVEPVDDAGPLAVGGAR
jgi:hypothetical protein